MELKPCPFCGADPEMDSHQAYRTLTGGMIGSRLAIYCTNCPADIGMCREDVPEATRGQLIEEISLCWNSRPTTVTPRLGGPMNDEEMRETLLKRNKELSRARKRIAELEAEVKALKEAAMIYATNAGHSKSCLKVRSQRTSASTVDKEICVCGHRDLVDILQDGKG